MAEAQHKAFVDDGYDSDVCDEQDELAGVFFLLFCLISFLNKLLYITFLNSQVGFTIACYKKIRINLFDQIQQRLQWQ